MRRNILILGIALLVGSPLGYLVPTSGLGGALGLFGAFFGLVAIVIMALAGVAFIIVGGLAKAEPKPES